MMTPRTSEEVPAMAFPAAEKPLLPTSRSWLFLIAACLFLTGVHDATAGNMQQPDSMTVIPHRTPGPLDGKSFAGEFGPIGKPADGIDTWVFRDGSFWSKSCLECGFPRSVYSSTAESGAFDFKTTTSCPVSDAEIVWEGTVNDGKIEGVYTWTRKRWYRTIRKRFWFKGTLEGVAAGADEKGS
jgi:hypothetical protein